LFKKVLDVHQLIAPAVYSCTVGATCLVGTLSAVRGRNFGTPGRAGD